MANDVYAITGMTCAGCANSVQSALEHTQGIKTANVNFAANNVLIEWDESVLNIEQIRQVVQGVGYDLIVKKENRDELAEREQQHLQRLKQRMLGAGIFSIPLMILGMTLMENTAARYAMWALATPVVFWYGRDFFINAWKQLKHRRQNMDTLVALSTGISYIFSSFNTINPDYWHSRGQHAHVYFEASAVIIFFILLGKWLEERAKRGAGDAIRKLMQLTSDTARLFDEKTGQVKTIALTDLQRNQLILVNEGDRIPVDGELVDGEALIDESSVTGESIPILKPTGGRLFAGTTCNQGSFIMKATAVGDETMLARIIKQVETAQGSKAPVQKLADKIAAVFVPAVLLIALITFAEWSINNNPTQGILSAITVLVIACPCALGLATPTALMAGIGRAARMGILIRNAGALEHAASVTDLILDKTGTLTEGKPQVIAEHWLTNSDSEALKSILFNMEQRSVHPLAHALTLHLGKCEPVNFHRVNNEKGKGLQAITESETYYSGTEEYIELSTGLKAPRIQLTDTSSTLVWFASSGAWLACFELRDPLKPTTIEAISRLKKMGIRLHLLSGDRTQVVAHVAAETGIENYKGHCLPADKSTALQELKLSGAMTGMAGDGINDSEALAYADVSFAMSGGSDIAMDVADITLLNGNLNLIPEAIALSKATRSTVKQNLFWAFIYNIIGIPVAAGLLIPINGWSLDPMIAAAAMALSSVSVVGNSLLLKLKRL